MILQHSHVIAAAPAAVFTFFRHMDVNYSRWHPDHILFRWLDEGGLARGNRFYFEERINGEHIRRTVRISRLEPERLLEFVPENAFVRFFLRAVCFSIEPVGNDSCRLTQTLTIRIGPIGRWLNRRGFAAVERHMREEGANLEQLVAGQDAGRSA